jgi:hypothetical protein
MAFLALKVIQTRKVSLEICVFKSAKQTSHIMNTDIDMDTLNGHDTKSVESV